MATGWIILAQFVCIQLASGDVVNLALKKPVNMSSQYDFFTPATKAVDGNKGTNGVIDQYNAIHTALNKTFAWWWVDLQSQVHDATVKIYFRTNYKLRRNGVQLYTSTTRFNTYPSGDLCHNVTGTPDGADIPDVVSVNCSGTWQYLMVYTDTNNGDGIILDFGEVEVLACSTGTYGANCTLSCGSRHCSITSSQCDRYTGACPGGCEAGWTGINCTQACAAGMYGSGCNSYCDDRHCSGSSSCNHVTGRCDNGCQTGWTDTDCLRACPVGTYGDTCSQLCNDRHCLSSSDTCDHVTGTCTSGCQPGWNGTDCKLQCPEGTFGIGCLSCSTRHCQGESDCPGDGACSGGCQDGWTLESCTQACPSGEYGPDCGLTCGNCTGDNICNHVTGNCPGDCKTGWRGSQCKQTCPSGKYGVNCMETCGHCADTCDVVDGHCLGGCEEGYCGAQCHLQLIRDTGVDSVSAVIGAVIGAVVMFVVVGAVHFCFLRNGRLQWMKSSRPKDPTQPREMTDIARPHDISHGVAERPLSGSGHTCNNDYAVLATDTKSDNKNYDVIKNKHYENM